MKRNPYSSFSVPLTLIQSGRRVDVGQILVGLVLLRAPELAGLMGGEGRAGWVVVVDQVEILTLLTLLVDASCRPNA
jgi:hypothetical protein